MFKLSALLLAAGAIALSGCNTSTTSPSGFLADYQQLQPDPSRFDSALIYVNPDANLKNYDRIIIDVVTIRGSLTDEESTALEQYFGNALNRELSKDYKVVQTPGPNTIELRTALATPPNTTGWNIKDFVNTTNIEGEVVASQSKERLIAIADKPLEELNPNDTLETKEDIKELLDAAAVRIRNGLADHRARIAPGS